MDAAGTLRWQISKEEYAVYVERVQKLLSGDTASLLAELSDRMNEAAVAMKFERAAQLRDARRAIEDLSATNAVIDFDPDARDYLAWAAEGVLATYTVFSMRGGKMTGRELYRARTAATEEESLELFLTTYYSLDRLPPPRIYLAEGNLDFNNLSLWFKKELGTEPVFLSADERRHEAVLALAHQNAREDLVRRLKERGAGPALDELARELNLQARPDHIEGFDIAQLDGKHTVASLIVFKDGIPDKKNYRHFRLRTVEGKIDDFGAMREVVSRRYSRLLADGDDIPKLILIDGGLGQVNAAKGVLDELGLDCDLVGLAKRDEELWLPGASRPIRLAKSSEALKVLQFVRDETHRFATGFNQKLRSKDLSLQSLQSVEGIGASRAAKLIKEFGSLDAIASSSFEEIAGRCSLSEDLAKAIGAAARQALAERAAEKERLRSSQAKTRRGAIKRGAIKRGAITKRGAPMYEIRP
ncbi:hypothetical protein MASR2M78_30620 [Treponema sp.]